jgi:murein hydrolase activator
VIGRAIAVACGLTIAIATAAAVPPREDLDAVRDRLEAVRRELRESEGTRDAAADRLRDAERAVSDADRRVRELARDRDRARRDLARLAERSRRTRDTGSAQRTQLERMLVQQATLPESSTLALWLTGDDPREAARRAVLLGYVARARAAVVAHARNDLAALDALSAETAARQASLEAIEREEAAQHEALARERAREEATLADVSQAVKAKRIELAELQRAEARLGQLVERLARAVQPVRPKPDRTALSGPREADDAGPRTGAARPRLPVDGELVSRFGSPRSASGVSAKGVFIRAPAGAEVHAIADGQVVFVDWMRGFGNLVIVDHGDGRMSLYAHVASVLATLGAAVRAGEAIATVGSSGGAAQPGLYFETRRDGRPFDPLAWGRNR